MAEQFTDQDRQQVKDLMKNGDFLAASGEQRDSMIKGLSVYQKLPGDKNWFTNTITKYADVLHQQNPNAPRSSQTPSPTAPPPQSGLSKAWDWANTPISKTANGYSLRELNRDNEQAGWVNSMGKQKPDHPKGLKENILTASDTVFDETAGLADAITTPLGIATMELGPVIRGLKIAGEPLLAKIIKGVPYLAEKAVRTGYGMAQINDAWSSLKEAMNDPTTENITRFVTRAVIGGVATKPEGDAAIRRLRATPEVLRSAFAKAKQIPEATRAAGRGFKEGVAEKRSGRPAEKTTPEPPKPVVPKIIEDGAKKHGVSIAEYEEAHKLGTGELAGKMHETANQVRELKAAESYNKRAATAIHDAGAQLEEARAAADEKKFSLKDAAKEDEKVAKLEAAIKEFQENIVKNQNKITDLRKSNIEAHAKMYETMAKDSGVPVGEKPKPAATAAPPEKPKAQEKPKEKATPAKQNAPATPATTPPPVAAAPATPPPAPSPAAPPAATAPPPAQTVQMAKDGAQSWSAAQPPAAQIPAVQPPQALPPAPQGALPAAQQAALPPAPQKQIAAPEPAAATAAPPKATMMPPVASPASSKTVILPPLKPKAAKTGKAIRPPTAAVTATVLRDTGEGSFTETIRETLTPEAYDAKKKALREAIIAKGGKVPGKAFEFLNPQDRETLGDLQSSIESPDEPMAPDEYDSRKKALATAIMERKGKVAKESFEFLNEQDREDLGKLQDIQLAKSGSPKKPADTSKEESGSAAPAKEVEHSPEVRENAEKADDMIANGTWRTLDGMRNLKALSLAGNYELRSARVVAEKVEAGEKISVKDLKHLSPTEAYGELAKMEKQGLITEDEWDWEGGLKEREEASSASEKAEQERLDKKFPKMSSPSK